MNSWTIISCLNILVLFFLYFDSNTNSKIPRTFNTYGTNQTFLFMCTAGPWVQYVHCGSTTHIHSKLFQWKINEDGFLSLLLIARTFHLSRNRETFFNSRSDRCRWWEFERKIHLFFTENDAYSKCSSSTVHTRVDWGWNIIGCHFGSSSNEELKAAVGRTVDSDGKRYQIGIMS